MAAKMDQNGIQKLQNGLQEGVRKRCEKWLEKSHASDTVNPPWAPLKKLQIQPIGKLADLQGTRDTPLVPRGHGGG